MSFRTQIHKKKFCKNGFHTGFSYRVFIQGTMSHRPLTNSSSLKNTAAYCTYIVRKPYPMFKKPQVWDLSWLCPETSRKLSVHEFGFCTPISHPIILSQTVIVTVIGSLVTSWKRQTDNALVFISSKNATLSVGILNPKKIRRQCSFCVYLPNQEPMTDNVDRSTIRRRFCPSFVNK